MTEDQWTEPLPPHELLVDTGGHTCAATCLALYGNAYLRTPPPLSTTGPGYQVQPGGYSTTDPVLARHVADELDRVDPLPCSHVGADLIDISTVAEGPGSTFIRTCCGDLIDGQ